MTNLNTGMTDDLGHTDSIDPGINLPGTVTSVSGLATVQTVGDTNVPLEEEQDKDDAVQELLDKDVVFEIMSDKVEDIISMQEVEDTILGEKVIDRSGAATINMAFEGFLGDKLSLNEFTHEPTRTNFQFSANYMGRRIAQEQADVVELLGTPLEKYQELITHARAALVETIFPRLDKDIYEVHSTLEMMELDPRELIVPTTKEFVNLYKLELGKDQPVSTVLEDVATGMVKFDMGAVAFGLARVEATINANKELALLLNRLALGQDTAKIVEDNRFSHNQDLITLETLVKAYESEEITKLIGTCTKLLESLDEAIEPRTIENYEQAIEYVESKAKQSAEDMYKMKFIATFTYGLSQVTGYMLDILAALKKQ